MTKKHALALLICFASLIITSALSRDVPRQALAKFAAPDGGCWCTTYVANYYDLPSNYPNAYQWSSWLRELGWRKDSLPHEGDIEVLQPQAKGAGKPYGHVGIIQTAVRTDYRQWSITLRGAYQQRQPEFRDADCHNVSDWTSSVTIERNNGISYYYKPGVSTW